MFFIDPNQCLVFFCDPEGVFAADRMKQVLADHGVIVEGDAELFALTWDGAVTLYASLVHGEAAAALASRVMGRGRKHRAILETCDAYIEISFEDLDEVLDEINTLTVVQTALQQATSGLLYRSWNWSFSGPDD